MRIPLTPIMDPKFNWSRSHNTARGYLLMRRWKNISRSNNVNSWMWQVNHELALHTLRLNFRLGLQQKRRR